MNEPIAPTWVGMLPMILLLYEHGTAHGRAQALVQLKQLATLADKYADEHGE